MMYSEFINGTGCRDNKHNFEVYNNLEAMYMNTEMTKEQIYEYGKKLVNNELDEDKKEFNEKMKKEIAEIQDEIEYYKTKIETTEYYLIGESDTYWIAEWEADIKRCKDIITENNKAIQLRKELMYK